MAIDELVALIEDASGIVIPEREWAQLEKLARERARLGGHPDIRSYVEALVRSRGAAELRELLSRITVNESQLFRGPQQFRALAKRILPELVDHGVERELRAWSAGCARGEEALTLAIVMSECRELSRHGWRVLATDVDEGALAEAGEASYGDRAVALVEPELLEKYFSSEVGGHTPIQQLRERIDYRQLNLVEQPLRVPYRPFDLIFLRNVMIYLGRSAQQRVIAAVADCLSPGGYLFVGPSESLRQLDTGLETVDLGDCFCYRRRRAGERAAGAAGEGRHVAGGLSEETPALPKARSADGGASSVELGELARRVARELTAGCTDRAMELASGGLRRAPEDARCRALLGRTLELSGDTDGAVVAYRAALYLDPRLSTVRYLLGSCHRRLERPERSRAEFRTVLAAIASDEADELPELSELDVPELEEVERRCREALEG
jgi:chemotaxis protein methyltransferase CheR